MGKLQKMKFKNDKNLKFDAKSHSYFYKEKRLESVTTFIKRFQKPFNRMKWSQHVADRDGLKKREVLRMWDMKSKESMAFGTRIHEFAERHALVKIGKESKDYNPAKEREKAYRQSILKFWEAHPELAPLDIERRVCVPVWLLGGTLDMSVRSDDGHIYIIDWKTNKSIDTFSKYRKYMYPPLAHLDDCNFNVYSLQLSLYAYMLEKRYGYKISGLYLIHLKENDFKEYKCNYMKSEVEKIIDWRLLRINAR